MRAGSDRAGRNKEHLWFSLEKEHENWQSTPVFFFEIFSEGYSYGMGIFEAPPAVMKKFRDRLDANPAEFLGSPSSSNRRRTIRFGATNTAGKRRKG